ncbi:MAG: 4Fe-4S dicluster domain-containing protein [Chloroflexi bacterium]|nr:4Fe-4S dicluster domain-containing protein [Chloroflexota bacterium]
MLDLSVVENMLDSLGNRPPQVEPKTCLNNRHKDAGCRRCVDACPSTALSLNEVTGPTAGTTDVIVLDVEQCVGCGLCLRICPTNVFQQRSSPEIKLLDAFHNLRSSEPVELTCPQNEQPHRSRVPNSTVVGAPRCLSALSVPLLLALQKNSSALWLNDAVCESCPIGQTQPYIADSAIAANMILAAFGRPATLRTYTGDSEALGPPAERPVLSGEEPVYSRRDFFGSLGRLTRQAAVAVLSESLTLPEPGGPRPVDQRLPHQLPENRRQLLTALRALGAPTETQIDLHKISAATVLIDGDKCSACGLCARFCPTGALEFLSDESHFVINFLPAACVDCGICDLICPDDAVSFAYQNSIAPIIETEPGHLQAGNLVPCARCKQPVAGTPDTPVYCYVCSTPRPQEALLRSLPM